MDLPERHAAVRARLDSYLATHDLAAVWFARPAAFAWLTGGDNVVDRASEVGVAAAGYDGDLVVVTNDIEAERLRDEELPAGTRIETFPWHEGTLADAVAARSPTPAAADFEVTGFRRVAAGALCQPLLAADIDAYRDLGRETAAAVERVCREADPADTERAVAADLRGTLAARGIDTPVALVGGSERAPRYRHYTPQDAPLGDYALVSVTAERDGLFASCTRTVAFDPPGWLAARHEAAARVETTALAATRAVGRAGGTAGAVFAHVQAAYAALGWEGEWKNHHQGGAAGFAGREWIATPGHAATVELPMAYAWNPTVQGAKSEGTVLVSDAGFESLTAGDWPTTEAAAVGFDVTLDRPAVLER
jgi:Xaa-Pro aminopeptidase